MANKKIKGATTTCYNGIQFKSSLEVMIYKTLLQEGFHPKYEEKKFTLWYGFKPTIPFYNKGKDGLNKLENKKLIDITYTPDFTFEYNGYFVIIEAKGYENDIFPIKKKMFRKILEAYKKALYFEIFTKKQLVDAIKIIKEYE